MFLSIKDAFLEKRVISVWNATLFKIARLLILWKEIDYDELNRFQLPGTKLVTKIEIVCVEVWLPKLIKSIKTCRNRFFRFFLTSSNVLSAVMTYLCSDSVQDYGSVLNQFDVRGTTVLRVIGRFRRLCCKINIIVTDIINWERCK